MRSSFWFKLPWFITALIFWGLILVTLLKVDPDLIRDIGLLGLYLPFLLCFFFAVLFTLAPLRSSLVKSLVWASTLTGFALLRVLGIGHLVNFFLILGLLISLEVYWRHSPHPKI